MRKRLTQAQVDKNDAKKLWEIKEILQNIEVDSDPKAIASALDSVASILLY